MKKTRVAIVALSAAAAAAGGLWLQGRVQAGETPAWRFVTVERGDLESVVSATGQLAAVRTVQVGTQVSGQVAQMEVDFNQRVQKGQLLARIDPTLARQAVSEAQASLARTTAELAAARKEHERTTALLEEGLVAPSDYDALESRVAVARANVSSARVAVQRAGQNLAYTEIRSPIDGVVVERNVDVGQTVAASLQAPQLFLIANDLSRMQIVVSVDESDIARIRQGQEVRFTVQARPNERFRGRVEQVRLQSTTLENVVSYGVVVSVENPDGKLLPGMTARVEFMVDAATDVLRVANAALRFQPEGQEDPGAPPGRSASGRARAAARLWTVDANGKLAAIPVRTGIANGVMTQVEGEGLSEGMRVVAGVRREEAGAPAAANPLQPSSGGRRGPGRPGGF